MAERKKDQREEQSCLYIKLIEQLLSSSDEELSEILNSNSNLINHELVEKMFQVTKKLKEQEEENDANFLESLAVQLKEELEYLEKRDFLLDLLVETAKANTDKNREKKLLYPLLAANLDKLNESLADVLRRLGTETLLKVKQEEKHDFVSGILNFSNYLIQDFPLGDRPAKLEIAIVGYDLAATVFTLNTSPKDWATVRNCLGVAYSQRILGNEEEENLEIALSHFRAALQVRKYKDFPADWVMTQNNMGTTFFKRLRDNRAKNLEKAIACLKAALQVCVEKGDLSEQLARVQDNLGTVYRERIKGDPQDNLEMAIAFHQTALQVYTPEKFPEKLARTQYHLGVAYSDRTKGNEEENLETALSHFRAALQVLTEEKDPQKWAMIQNSMGLVYAQRKYGNPQENLEMAIAAYQSALLIYKRDSDPREWGMVQNNLGNAYSDLKNQEQAIAAYQLALQIYTRKNNAYRWAAIQNNLAGIYRDQGNTSAAFDCLNLALEVYTPKDFPVECLKIGRNLGNIAFAAQSWENAIQGYGDAIKALETSRAWVSTDKKRQEMLEGALDVYKKMVLACLNNNQSEKALEYAERSKARTLVELLAKRDLYPNGNVSQTTLEKLKRLRREIIVEEKRLEIEENIELKNSVRDSSFSLTSKLSFISNRTHLNKLQQELEQLIAQKIKPIDPIFSLTQQVEGISFNDIQLRLDESTAIIEWFITAETFHAFIITHQSQSPIVWSSSCEDLKNLVAKFDEYILNYVNKKEQWRTELVSYLQNFAQILNLDTLISLIPEACNHIILIPYRALHLIPIHALPLSDNQCLLERFPSGLQYAPSCQVLKLLQNQSPDNLENLFAIQNPTISGVNQLLFTDLEVEIISSFFPTPTVLSKNYATKNSVKNFQNFSSVHCAHFSCHGEFNFNSPLESALILANKERWILGEIFELSIPQCRLVTFSACETGLTDFNSRSDEYIGLPNGFLFAGSSSVVSSLWTVDELSTTFLMIKFYENLPKTPQSGEVALALKQAQEWLRNLTIEELDRFLGQYKPQVKETYKQWRKGQIMRFEESLKRIRERQPQPFGNPYYWAAFIAIGF